MRAIGVTEFSKWFDELKQLRDELRLQIHLGSKELQREWDRLEKKWNEFSRKAELQKTAAGLEKVMMDLGAELKLANERLSKARKS